MNVTMALSQLIPAIENLKASPILSSLGNLFNYSPSVAAQTAQAYSDMMSGINVQTVKQNLMDQVQEGNIADSIWNELQEASQKGKEASRLSQLG